MEQEFPPLRIAMPVLLTGMLIRVYCGLVSLLIGGELSFGTRPSYHFLMPRI